MAFRSHTARAMDLSLLSNRLILGLTGITLIGALTIWATGGSGEVFWAPAHTFFVWALAREIDPDHDWTALASGLVAGVWVLAGLDVMGILAVIGLMIAARIVVDSTGRRPLVTDLVALGAFATFIAFTPEGWVAGFGLAIALYIDDRMTGEPTVAGALTAALAALGASGVASLNSVFPEELPGIRPLFVIAVGVLTLISAIREPTPPTSLVDSRRKTPIELPRLHVSRALTGVLLFATAFLLGSEAVAVAPATIALALGLVATEITRIRNH